MSDSPMDRVLADTRTPGTPPPLAEWAAWDEERRQAYAKEHLTPEEWEQAQFHLDKALIQLIVYFPFFGFMASSMAAHKVWVRERGVMHHPTMATDGKKLYIWPQFALYHDVRQLMGVLLHELFHNVLFHPARGAGYDPELRNVAMDYTVNLMVNDAGREASEHNIKSGPMDPAMQSQMPWYIPIDGQYCYDERYRDDHGNPLMWEEIYNLLLAEAKRQCSGSCDPGDGSRTPCPQCGKTGGQTVDDHDVWRPGNRPADDEGDVNDAPFSPEEVQRWALDANAKCSGDMQGSVPAGMKRRIDEWLNPPLPWHRLLQSYMKFVPYDFGWAPGDVRFPDPMPCIVEELDLTYITFGFDTSGSMSPQEIAASVENARSIMRGFPAMKGRAYFWDAQVHDRMDLEEFDGTVRDGVHGGGGTSIRPQFLAIGEDGIKDKTSVHVCFTDGYVDWDSVDPDELPYDVLWVITNDRQSPPEHPRYRMTRLHVS